MTHQPLIHRSTSVGNLTKNRKKGATAFVLNTVVVLQRLIKRNKD
jgi:hypothetical protein